MLPKAIVSYLKKGITWVENDSSADSEHSLNLKFLAYVLNSKIYSVSQTFLSSYQQQQGKNHNS